MFGETRSQKEKIVAPETSPIEYQTGVSFNLSYNKISKLITALYMVTDIMDKEEPLRNKLRKLGADIISDIHLLSYKTKDLTLKIDNKISELMSFLDIANGVRMISEMNSSILKKEFIQLRESINEFMKGNSEKSQEWLEEFFKEEISQKNKYIIESNVHYNKGISKGHQSTRIGVQKASTLLKALSDRIPDLSKNRDIESSRTGRENFELKNKRRDRIISIIKDKQKDNNNFIGVTITDIKSISDETLASCSEKTLQRELVSLVFNGVLKKTGSKRWSRYSLN